VDLNDELLCAYLDDELDAAQRQQVTAALSTDAGARLRLQRMRDADRDLQAALPLLGSDHFEEAMKARITAREPALNWRRHVLPWASAAAVAGLFVGYLAPRVMTAPQSDAALVQLSPALHSILETQPAGASNGTAVALTFKAQDSRFCRLFRGTVGAAIGEGLACRSSEGAWQLAAWDAAVIQSGEAFRPAGASAAVDAVMTALGGEPALDAEAEAQLIKQGWHP
jgi:hypothetical protein